MEYEFIYTNLDEEFKKDVIFEVEVSEGMKYLKIISTRKEKQSGDLLGMRVQECKYVLVRTELVSIDAKNSKESKLRDLI